MRRIDKHDNNSTARRKRLVISVTNVLLGVAYIYMVAI